MARPSKLSPLQWAELERRHAAGESAANLAREYGVSDAAVSKRVSKVTKETKILAIGLAKAQLAVDALPITQQYRVLSLAEKIRGMQDSLASAAELGAKTAHKMAAMANLEASKLDDADPQAIGESVKAIAILSKTGNEAGALARDMMIVQARQTGFNEPEPEQPAFDASGLSTEALAEILALRDAARK